MDFIHRKKRKSFHVILQHTQRYPGDFLRGIVQIHLEAPLKYTSFKVRVSGEEVVVFGMSLTKASDIGSRRTMYYSQDVLVAGQSREASAKESKRAIVKVWSEENGSPEPLSDDAINSALPQLFTQGLMPGIYSFPFAVRLPNTLPPSYEHKRGIGTSRMSYCVKAKLFLGSRVLEKDQCYFRVRMLPINPVRWFSAHRKEKGGHALKGANGLKSPENGDLSVLLFDHTVPLYTDELCDKSGKNEVEANDNGSESFRGDNDDINNLPEQVSDRATQDIQVHVSQISNSAVEDDDEESENCEEWIPSDDIKVSPSDLTKIFKAQRESDVQFPHEATGKLLGRPSALTSMPPSEQILDLHFNGLFKNGKTTVHLILPSYIYTRGRPVKFRAIVDNSHGLAAIKKITFTLVNSIDMKTKMDCQEYRWPMITGILKERISLEHSFGMPEKQLMLPENAPLTLITDGIECRNFLEVSVTCVHMLKKYTSEARIEIVIVDSFTENDQSQRLRTWSNDFRGRELKADQTTSPEISSPFTLTGYIRVLSDELDNDNFMPSGNSVRTIGHDGEIGSTRSNRSLDFENAVYVPKSFPKHVESHAKNPLVY